MTTELEYLCPLLNVFDMEASLKFYTEILGFSTKQKAGPPDDVGWVMMEWNGSTDNLH